jgi:hypothetical protein
MVNDIFQLTAMSFLKSQDICLVKSYEAVNEILPVFPVVYSVIRIRVPDIE